MPNFELYIRTSGRRDSRGETVTIQPRGVISFSKAAWQRLGNPEAVVVLTDRAENLIGFRPAVVGEAAAYAVRFPGRVISAVALLRYMGVSSDVARRYPLITEGGLPSYIDLKARGTPVTSNRRKG